ncbi:MAG TPA: peptidoglycan DD-metalloendopeptidase family protein [Candidatus Paceibacterota bacterium]
MYSISTIRTKINKAIEITRRAGGSFFGVALMRFLPVLLVIFLLLGINHLFVSEYSFGSEKGVLGGPEVSYFNQLSAEGQVALLETNTSPATENKEYLVYYNLYNLNNSITFNNSTFLNTGSILGDILSKQDNFFIYKVQKGDTLLSLARTFNIATSTILWANASVLNSKPIKVNEELIILPVSGILHWVSSEETIESIAELYNINPQDIEKFNNLNNSSKNAIDGQKIIIPHGQPKKDLAVLVKSLEELLPNLNGYFSFPTEKSSWNWGILHTNNAVDIANVCGTPIFASADGLITKIGNPNNWNDGYGGYVEIEHQNGTKTLYTHTEKNTVSIGTITKQGDIIAKIGRSGNVHGPTGCHLHFEVHRAKNPFIK